MDVAYFLRQRTEFTRYFYDEGCKPFLKIKADIEAEVAPYETSGFVGENSDGEPPYLEEWLQADAALQMLGMSAVSMLSDTLKIYFNTLERELGFSFEKTKAALKDGFVMAYRDALAKVLSTNWSKTNVRFDVIEQVVLARNRGQHSEHLSILPPTHDEKTLKKHPLPLFVAEHEKRSLEETGEAAISRFFLNIEISRNTLFEAIAQVEALASYVEAHEDRVEDWRRRVQSTDS